MFSPVGVHARRSSARRSSARRCSRRRSSAPSVFSPVRPFSPSAFSPRCSRPSAFFSRRRTAAYESARRSLIAISANDGTATSTSSRTPGTTPAASTSASTAERRLRPGRAVHAERARERRHLRRRRAEPATLLSTRGPDRRLQTLILTDYGRHADDGRLATMESKLAGVRRAPRSSGAIVDLGSASPQVEALNAQADAQHRLPVRREPRRGRDPRRRRRLPGREPGPEVHRASSATTTSIPFFRYPDTAGLGPESNYVPPVLDDTPRRRACSRTTSSRRTPTARTTVLHLKGVDLPVPDLPVGRLVETPTEISGMLDAYTRRSRRRRRRRRPRRSSPATTSWPSGARRSRATSAPGSAPGATNDTLITNRRPPSDTGTRRPLVDGRPARSRAARAAATT